MNVFAWRALNNQNQEKASDHKRIDNVTHRKIGFEIKCRNLNKLDKKKNKYIINKRFGIGDENAMKIFKRRDEWTNWVIQLELSANMFVEIWCQVCKHPATSNSML